MGRCRAEGLELNHIRFSLFSFQQQKNRILIVFTGPGMWLMQALFEDKVGALRIFDSPMPNHLDSFYMISCTKGQVTTTVLEVCKVFLFCTVQ